MKKLLKIFAVPAILALGLLAGCSNEDRDFDFNITVSTERPELDNPVPFEYGVLLSWRCGGTENTFRITRQAKDGEEKILEYNCSKNSYRDLVGFENLLAANTEYTYRVYKNSADNESLNDYYVVKNTYAEKRITFSAEKLKAQGSKLDPVVAENVKCMFKNNRLAISFLNDENHCGYRDISITDVETGKKIYRNKKVSDNSFICSGLPSNKINVSIMNVWKDEYYEASDAVTIEGIENIEVEESVDIKKLQASMRGNTIVLLWTTEDEVDPNEITIERKEGVDALWGTRYVEKDNILNDETGEWGVEVYEKYIVSCKKETEFEVLNLTPTYEEKYDGTHYWKIVDESIAFGKNYRYKVTIGDNRELTDWLSGSRLISDLSADYVNYEKAVILKWTATDISDFVIYRADKDLVNAYDPYKYYDLFQLLAITAEKVYDITGDSTGIALDYTAKDTTVEENKEYTYIVTSATDGFKVCSVPKTASTGDISGVIEGGLNLSVYDKDGSYKNSLVIEATDDTVVLSFNGNSAVAYKGYWTTSDNKGLESGRKPFDFSNDKDTHYRKAFTLSDFGADITKPIDFKTVKFYVQLFDGDTLLQHDGKNEYEKSVDIVESLTSYATFNNIYARQNNKNNDTKREIIITVYGKKIDTNKIGVTYFKNSGEVQTANLTNWEKLEGQDAYESTFLVAEDGTYTVCVTVPGDNMYNYSDSLLSENKSVNVKLLTN